MPDDPRESTHRRISLKRGETLEAPRESCLRIWIVEDGTVAVCTSFPDGRRQITGLEMRGDAVCAAATAPNAPGWLEALEDSTVFEMDFTRQAQVLKDDPRFLEVMFRMVHDRLETASRHMTTLGRLDSTERVILFLAEMALRANADAPQTRPVRLPMSREDIADYLGLNAETVSRIMGRLKKSGLFRFLSPTEYMMPDLARVERRLPVPVFAFEPKTGLASDSCDCRLEGLRA